MTMFSLIDDMLLRVNGISPLQTFYGRSILLSVISISYNYSDYNLLQLLYCNFPL